MMHVKPALIFDTSGLNALADDHDSGLIVRSLGVGFRVRLSETNICEVAATDEQERRMKLLHLCSHLVHAGECIYPYHEILQLMSRTHAQNPRVFDWHRVDVRWRELEEEVARRDFIGSQETADEIRADNRLSNRQFLEMWREAHTKFEAELNREEPVSLDGVFETLEPLNSPLWRLAANIYKTTTGIELNQAEAKAFVESCPPAKAMLYANCVGQYHWGVKSTKDKSLYKSGRLDVFSATYLPFCENFVTRDQGQCNALRIVAEKIGQATEVCMYADFRRKLLIAA